MRVLVLGGTHFVGRHLVDALRADGHTVAVFNRGRSPLPFSDVEQLRGDRETGDLEALRGRDWDACVDVNGYLPQHVRASAARLRGHAARYVFISTGSVYPTVAGTAIDESSPLFAPPAGEVDAVTPELYGPLKVGCEQEAEAAFPGETLILRPGIVAGPFDPTNRFPWWVRRVARGGEVLAPAAPEEPVQVVDGRDLAIFATRLLTREATGVFNVCGDAATFGELLTACRAGTGSRATFTWVSEQFLLAEGIEPFEEVPLWIADADEKALYGISNARGLAAGLELRTFAETARDTWEWLQAVEAGELAATPSGYAVRGLSAERESALLTAFAALP